jgi:hypothetical protein
MALAFRPARSLHLEGLVILLDFHLPDCVMTLRSEDIVASRSREIGKLVADHLTRFMRGRAEPEHDLIANVVEALVHGRTGAYDCVITFNPR